MISNMYALNNIVCRFIKIKMFIYINNFIAELIKLINKVYQMNLTISQPKQSLVPPSHNQQPRFIKKTSNQPSTKKQQVINNRQNCSNFFLSCMNVKEHQSSEKDQIYQDVRINKVFSPQSQLNTPHKQKSSNHRKKKISLSLNQKTQQHTPIKIKNTEPRLKYQSEQKKLKTEQAKQQLTYKEQNIAIKLKTEPRSQIRKKEESIHQINGSYKPSLMTSLHSSRKSNEIKSKLQIISTFKSQLMTQEPKVVHFQENPILPISHQSNLQSDQLLIEESFMTAKLANIYGDRNNDLQLFPKSNIVYYNKIMANQQIWKSPTKPQYNEVTFYHIPEQQHRNFNKKEFKDVSIQRQIPEEMVNQKEQQANFKSRFKDRKWIGEYAKTIKTFNESNDFNSEAESIVLQKGYNQSQYYGNPIVPLNRGSIKQYREQSTVKRSYGSVKQDYNSANGPRGDHKFMKLMSNTIEEVLQDQDINIENKQYSQ